MHIPGGSPTVVELHPVTAKDKELTTRKLVAQYGRKARMLRRQYNRQGLPDDHADRTIQFSPKHYAEAARIGLDRMEGLRIVL